MATNTGKVEVYVRGLYEVKEHVASLSDQLAEERLVVRELSVTLTESNRAHKARIAELENENVVLRSLLPQEEPETYATTDNDVVLNHEKPAGGQNRFDVK